MKRFALFTLCAIAVGLIAQSPADAFGLRRTASFGGSHVGIGAGLGLHHGGFGLHRGFGFNRAFGLGYGGYAAQQQLMFNSAVYAQPTLAFVPQTFAVPVQAPVTYQQSFQQFAPQASYGAALGVGPTCSCGSSQAFGLGAPGCGR